MVIYDRSIAAGRQLGQSDLRVEGRAASNARQAGYKTTFRVEPDTGWATQAFHPDASEYRPRVSMAFPLLTAPGGRPHEAYSRLKR
jgi:hypothetical protein